MVQRLQLKDRFHWREPVFKNKNKNIKFQKVKKHQFAQIRFFCRLYFLLFRVVDFFFTLLLTFRVESMIDFLLTFFRYFFDFF